MKATITFLCVLFASMSVSAQGLTDSLIVHYPLNGSAKDWSPNAYDGTNNGAMATIDTLGRMGRAMEFDGTNDYIDLGAPSKLANISKDSLSISLWFKADQITSTNSNLIVARGASDGLRFSLLLVDDIIRFNRYDGTAATSGNTNNAETSNTVEPNKWYHVVAVMDEPNSQVVFYVNGVANTVNYPEVYDGSKLPTSILIGAQDNNGSIVNYFDGAMSDLRIYNRKLTQADVAILSTFPTAPTFSGDTVCSFSDGADLTLSQASEYRFFSSDTSYADTLSTSGASFSTGTLLGDTTFYASIIENGIESPIVEINVVEAPATAPTLSLSGNDTLVVTGKGLSYKWFVNGGEVSGEDRDTLIATVTGSYEVVAISRFGCASDTSNMVSVTNVSTRISDKLATEMLGVFPNPTTGSFMIEGLQGNERVLIVDLSGKILIDEISNPGVMIVDEDLKSGLYIIKVLGKESSRTSKIVVK